MEVVLQYINKDKMIKASLVFLGFSFCYQPAFAMDDKKLLAAAYSGTPDTLAIIRKEYLQQKWNPWQLQMKLDPGVVPITLDDISFDELIINGSPGSHKLEPFNDTLKKFPLATRIFCKKLIEEKSNESQDKK
ncbi:hypothetical protein HYX58_01500 [Candidatus Dependentiae bacterium]|nr:hypothetical protein [Candidatus Dependentiae bacterium]